MRVYHVKDLRICHRSATDLLRNATVNQGQVCGCPFDCLFLIRKPFSCQSLADPVSFGYALSDICWHGSVMDERDVIRTSRMGIQTIRTLTDEIRKNYEHRVRTDFLKKSSMFYFSIMV